MILEKRDAMQSAIQVWNEKVIPAVLQYGESSSGKTSTQFSQASSDFEGTCTYVAHVPLSLYVLLHTHPHTCR